MQTIFIKKCLLWEVFVTESGSQMGGKRSADDEEAETTAKRLLCCDFDALAKQWDKRIGVGGGYIEK
jgi:hypothetical protein